MAAKSNKRSFDPREFLAKVGEGKTIVEERGAFCLSQPS
jgi:hypothetical protein